MLPMIVFKKDRKSDKKIAIGGSLIFPFVNKGKKNCRQKLHFGFFLTVLFSPQIPMIHWDLSTKRILTMEFAEGGQVNDRDYMKKHGINVNEVLRGPCRYVFYAYS